MKTKEVEEKLGLTKYTLRYYEKEGIIHPDKDDNGYRNYSDEDIQILHLVKFLRNLEISMDDIKGILNGELSFQECLSVNKIHLDHKLEHLQEVKKTMDNYHEKNIPLIPALAQVDLVENKKGLGYRKTNQEITLGKKPDKARVLRKWLISFLLTYILNYIGISIIGTIDDITIRIAYIFVLVLPFFILIHTLIFGLNDKMTTIENSQDQSIEFINDGIRYYQRKSMLGHVKYMYSIMLGKQDKYLIYRKYEDIDKIVLKKKRRYIKVGAPIATQVDSIDFTFYFKNGEYFYFYWPSTYDNDMKAIAIILDEVVDNVVDENDVLDSFRLNKKS